MYIYIYIYNYLLWTLTWHALRGRARRNAALRACGLPFSLSLSLYIYIYI